jgi:hypothetical protein
VISPNGKYRIEKASIMHRTIALAFLLFAVSVIAKGEGLKVGGLPASVQADRAGGAIRDPRVREYIAPKRIVWQSTEAGAVVEHAESLLTADGDQATVDNTTSGSLCTLRHNGKAPAILLDFGRELHGGVQITSVSSPNNHAVRVRLRFGESASEAMSELGGPKNATNDHAVRDQICRVPGLGNMELGNTGFRFLRIDLVDPKDFVMLKAVRAVFLYRDLPYLGSFRSNDERLNRIWQTGAYTVHLNMQDYLWDGIKRDRLVWIGDMYTETMTVCTVFGNVDVVPASLDLVRDTAPLPRWMNGISSYALWWVLIQDGWYRHHGDLAYLQRQKPYLLGLLKQMAGCIGPDKGEKMPDLRFLDWPSSENPKAVHAGLHSLLILSLEAGANLCTVLNSPAECKQCRDAVAQLRKHTPDPGNSKQAAALMALADLGDAATLNRSVMAVGGAERISTFYGYFVLQARAKAGDYQGCLDCIRNFWGKMLDLGATTFWEDFNLDWTVNAAGIDELVPPGKKDIHGDFGNYCYKGFRHSLCHGWASGPTAWLSEHVLGVKIVEPGCKAIQISPHLGDLQWVEGTFPTPQGIVKVRHEKQPDGSVRSTVDVPPGVRIVGNP